MESGFLCGFVNCLLRPRRAASPWSLTPPASSFSDVVIISLAVLKCSGLHFTVNQEIEASSVV